MPVKKSTPNPWANYDRATVERVCRTIWMASGEVGSGKTRFGLTAPGPILVQSLDRGLEGVIEGILTDMPEKEIYVKEYDWNPNNFTQEDAIAIRDAIIEDFTHGLEHAKTVLWDKETDIREVFQYAEFGDPIGGNIKDYAKLNSRYFHLINQVKSVKGVNFGLFQSMKNEWVVGEGKVNPSTGERKKTFNQSGKRIRAGYDRLDELVMTELHFVRTAGEFSIEIGKCRQNPKLQDKTIPGMTFSEFGTMLMEGTEESEWQ